MEKTANEPTDHGKQYASLIAVLEARAAGEIEGLRYKVGKRGVEVFGKGCGLPVYTATPGELMAEALSILGIADREI